MTYIDKLHEEMMNSPGYRAAHEESEPVYELASSMIGARAYADLTQTQIAELMGTTQSAVARLEGGRSNPSMRTLEKYAKATGTRLNISFEPIEVETDEPAPPEIQPEESEIRQSETEYARALD